MEISEALRFVQGAVARKNYDPALTHFRLSGGFIRSYNGLIALCSPIPLELDVTPKATPFLKAIQSCDDTVSLHITPAGKLAIKSGGFRAYVECLESEAYPDVQPEGTVIDLQGQDFLGALKVIEPFIGEDASRPWARGVLFRGQSIFATNNIIVVEHWLPSVFPTEINVPQEAISELLRIGKNPKCMWLSENTVTFEYENGCWLRSRLYATSWPDLSRILDRDSNQQPFPANFFYDLERLAPFVDKLGAVYFTDGNIQTSLEDAGAAVETHVHNKSAFHISHLRLLDGVADTIDFEQYPAPCLFYGENLRGAIAGMRV